MNKLLVVIIFFCISLISGCSSQPHRVKYYSLSLSRDASSEQQLVAKNLVVIEPIVLAQYLNYENLLFQVNENELNIALGARWSEKLDDSIFRVLAGLMENKLPAYRFEKQNHRWVKKPEYRIRIEFEHFHPTYQGETVTGGYFWVFDSANNLKEKKRFYIRVALDKNGYLHAVSKLDESLVILSEQVVQSLKRE